MCYSNYYIYSTIYRYSYSSIRSYTIEYVSVLFLSLALYILFSLPLGDWMCTTDEHDARFGPNELKSGHDSD